MSFSTQGYEIFSGLLTKNEIAEIKRQVSDCADAAGISGVRNADKKFPLVQSIANSEKLVSKASLLLGSQAKIVRVILFDKNETKNWAVSWHQDKTIAVSNKINVFGWDSWTLKDGIHHVQPDISVLDKMVTFRIHLDEADMENGCLNVIPKSHLLGLLKQQDISNVVASNVAVNCEVLAGDIVAMRPHLLHSSSRAVCASHRRVIHIEYSCFELPAGLSWA